MAFKLNRYLALFLPNFVIKTNQRRKSISEWEQRLFASPSPEFIKRKVLLRHNLSDATWVETGTCLGETTKILALKLNHVHSIEPEANLFVHAQKYLSSHTNISLYNSTSENIFPTLIPQLTGNIYF